MSRPPGLPKFQEAVSQKFSQNHRHGALFHICLTFFTKISSRISNYLQMAFQTLGPFREAGRKNVTKQTTEMSKNVIYVGNVAYCQNIPQ